MEWFRLIETDILPLIRDKCHILIHTDHGSARKNNKNGWDQGFMFHSRGVPWTNGWGWTEYRHIIKELLK